MNVRVKTILYDDGDVKYDDEVDATIEENIPYFILLLAYHGYQFSSEVPVLTPLTPLNVDIFRKNNPIFMMKLLQYETHFEQVFELENIDWSVSKLQVEEIHDLEEGKIDPVEYSLHDIADKCRRLFTLLKTGFFPEDLNIRFITEDEEIPCDFTNLIHKIVLFFVREEEIASDSPHVAGFKLVELVAPNYDVTPRQLMDLSNDVITFIHNLLSININRNYNVLDFVTVENVMDYFMMFAMFPIIERLRLVETVKIIYDVDEEDDVNLWHFARETDTLNIHNVFYTKKTYLFTKDYVESITAVDSADTTLYIERGYATPLDITAQNLCNS
jgi:hypothetical protein